MTSGDFLGYGQRRGLNSKGRQVNERPSIPDRGEQFDLPAIQGTMKWSCAVTVRSTFAQRHCNPFIFSLKPIDYIDYSQQFTTVVSSLIIQGIGLMDQVLPIHLGIHAFLRSPGVRLAAARTLSTCMRRISSGDSPPRLSDWMCTCVHEH